MNVAVLITGGKDSALALHRALKQDYKVKYLVAMFPEREDSWMFRSSRNPPYKGKNHRDKGERS